MRIQLEKVIILVFVTVNQSLTRISYRLHDSELLDIYLIAVDWKYYPGYMCKK